MSDAVFFKKPPSRIETINDLDAVRQAPAWVDEATPKNALLPV